MAVTMPGGRSETIASCQCMSAPIVHTQAMPDRHRRGKGNDQSFEHAYAVLGVIVEVIVDS